MSGPHQDAAPEARIARRFRAYADTLDCVHCGLCIPHCPTHGVTGRESDSPRGRIYLMRGWAEGRLELSDGAREHLDRCIVCRACESVCPSGIHMGEMMEWFRHESAAEHPSGAGGSRLGRFLLRRVLPHRRRIAALTDLMAIYRATGMRAVTGAVLARLAPGLARTHAMQPDVPPRRLRRIAAGEHPAVGPPRARVALFLGCIASEWFAPVHHATVRVLRRNGCDVVIPGEQTCCGALHRHAGMMDDARALLETNHAAFAHGGFDAIVVNAAGCGASLKEPVADEEPGTDGAPLPAYRDVCELLAELGIVPPDREIRARVAYDQPCHLVHGQRIGKDAVESLLSRIPGVEIVPLRNSDRCCGAGGVYNLLHPEMADPIRDAKIDDIVQSGAEIVVTGNPGCAMQIAAGLRGRSIEVLHPVELLDRAYSEEGFAAERPAAAGAAAIDAPRD
ncbi:MAG TPA: heterodisulfide reductase-related iron-sulfur binding cluster [bacterium]|nr:heterodisulfide reductase-related iron-sulfur binding cluster [bacterium]